MVSRRDPSYKTRVVNVFSSGSAYYGMFFAIPLRKLYILEQKLAFPSAVAAAFTIRSLHTGKNAEANVRMT